jgi:hypothetical protein
VKNCLVNRGAAVRSIGNEWKIDAIAVAPTMVEAKKTIDG